MKTRTDKFSNSLTGCRLIFKLCAVGLFLLQAGCGGGGGSASVTAVAPSPAQTAGSFKVVSDDYGVENATFLSATKSGASVVLRAAVADSMTDPDYRTVARIDISDPSAVSASGVYALGGPGNGLAPFAGVFYLFNGHQSTLLRTVGGSISFTSFGTGSGDRIAGSFSAVIEDGNDSTLPKGSYTVSGTFDFAVERSGAVLPAVAPVAANAALQYQAHCATCHSLGSIDQTASGAPDLSLMGGRMNGRFSPDLPGHQGITLSTAEINDLKVLLNVN